MSDDYGCHQGSLCVIIRTLGAGLYVIIFASEADMCAIITASEACVYN